METDKITSSYRMPIGEGQSVVDVVLQKDEDGGIVKVLSLGASAYVDDVEMLNGEAHYIGSVCVNALYVDDKGERNVVSKTEEFNGKIESNVLNPLMKPIYKAEIVGEKITDVDGDKARVVINVNVRLDALAMEEVDEIKTPSSEIELNKESMRNCELITSGTKLVSLNEEYDTKVDVERILINSAHVEVKSTSAGNGYFTIEGNVLINSLLEVKTDEELYLKNFMETIPFKEEIEDDLIQDGDDVFSFAYAKPQDLEISIKSSKEETEETKQSIGVNVNLTIKYYVTRSIEMEIYTDAFSMTNKTNIITDSFTVSKTMKSDLYKANIEGQTEINDSEPRIAKVAAITNEHICIANTSVSDGELTIEGVAYATIIYLTEDDKIDFGSIVLEIPFSNKFDAPEVLDGSLFVKATILDVDSKAKKGKEITTNIEASFEVASYSVENKSVIKDIELTEELLPSEYTLQIYIAPKDSTLWDISKHLLVSENILLKQNPNLVFPLESQQSIVYFRERQ